jgi:hypothetical protein
MIVLLVDSVFDVSAVHVASALKSTEIVIISASQNIEPVIASEVLKPTSFNIELVENYELPIIELGPPLILNKFNDFIRTAMGILWITEWLDLLKHK